MRPINFGTLTFLRQYLIASWICTFIYLFILKWPIGFVECLLFCLWKTAFLCLIWIFCFLLLIPSGSVIYPCLIGLVSDELLAQMSVCPEFLWCSQALFPFQAGDYSLCWFSLWRKFALITCWEVYLAYQLSVRWCSGNWKLLLPVFILMSPSFPSLQVQSGP